MFEHEYADLKVGDIVHWNGNLYQVDNLNGQWGIHGENEWIEIRPKQLDSWIYLGEAFIPENLNGHCWHYSGPRLSSYMYTPDFTCCHCGTRSVAQRKLESPPEGHGQYYPACNRKYLLGFVFSGNDESCNKEERI